MAEWSFDALAAAVRAASRDLATFHEVLAGKLAAALPPGTVDVKRAGLFGRRPLAELVVTLDDTAYRYRNEGGHDTYEVARVVRGIVLKTERVPFPEWLDALVRALWREAERREETRLRLERFLTAGES
ncbi:MAG: hypothetical protein K6V97_00685 [Actinomycetia bacterium]|nr:hypothetical protein [Actinomycetes bacterium]